MDIRDGYLFAAYASLTAFANWSAQEVPLPLQSLPRSLLSISLTLIPLQSFEMAFRLPLQPPEKEIFVMISPIMSKSICLEQTPLGLYV
jgi:hypothetical protein